MLAFGIRYLNGWVAARPDPSSIETEWPPHPGRVFMALAAAHFQTGEEPDEREALLWLEALEKNGEPAAPQIIASEKCERDVVTQYVPVNDKAGPAKALLQTVPLTRDRQPRTFVRAWLDDDTVFLVWPDAEPSEQNRASLEALCRKVARIGHSMSMVQMWLASPEELGDPNWVPNEERAVIHLRLAPRGTLELLERQFNGQAAEEYAALAVSADDPADKKAQKAARKSLKEDFPEGEPTHYRPSLSVYRGYAPKVSVQAKPEAAGTVFSPHLMVFEIERKEGAYRQLDLACAPALAGRWREALLSQSNGLSASVRRVLSGHDDDGVPLEDPHLGFAPLAFVGHEHGDGHLLGMGIALPRDLSLDDRRGVLRAVRRVRDLKLGRLGVWRLEAVTVDRPAWNLRGETWTAHPGGATEWSTVTPVVFDRHPKAKDLAAYRQEVAAMIEECCVRIGLPRPRQVILVPVSAHLGVPPAYAFPRLHRKDGSARRHAHMILIFDAPVCGPILVGAGRYRGYGLCRPLDPLAGGRVK